MVWEDMFVRHEIVLADQLLANPNNFRIHSRAQQAALEGSLDDLQWIGAVKVNVQTGHIFDGHLRVTLALRKGETTGVPVDYYDLTPEQEAQAILSIDPIAAMAGTDREQMETLLEMVNSDNAQTQQYLVDLAAREGLDYIERDGHERAGASPWERMNGESADGILFSFGAIVCRVPEPIYRIFFDNCPEVDIAEYVIRVISK